MTDYQAYKDNDFFDDTDAYRIPDAVKNDPFGDDRTMTFIASMPGFRTQLDNARVLPIAALKLNQRLNILGDGAQFVRDFEKALFGFSSAPDDVFLNKAKTALDAASLISDKTIEATRFLVEQRLLIGLVRRSVRGDDLPENFTDWKDFLPEGVYEIAKRSHRSKDLGLGVIYPYLLQLIDHLEKDEAILAEELILRVEWKTVSDISFSTKFNMEAVLLYFMKWHILRQWLARRPEESLAMINAEIDKIFEKTEIKL